MRLAGCLLIAYGVVGLAAPFAPMHLREEDASLTDTMHIILTMVTVLFMLVAIVFAATALGKGFRIYSIATILILLVFGFLAGMDGSRIAANLPTPWVGVTERINIGVFLLWVIVLAVVLLRTGKRQHQLMVKMPEEVPVGERCKNVKQILAERTQL